MTLTTRIHNALAFLLGTVLPPRRCSPDEVRHQLAAGRLRKVLWIRLQQGIGDLLLCTPAMRTFHEAYPQAEMHALVSSHNVAALSGHPRWERIWVRDSARLRSPWAWWHWLRNLRADHFDLVIVVHTHTPSWTNYAIARLLNPGVVWAFDSAAGYGGCNWSRCLADVELPPPSPALPEWQKFSALIAPLASVTDPRTELHIPADAQSWADREWAALELDGRPVIGLYLGGNAEQSHRLFPSVFWVRLIEDSPEAGRWQWIALAPENVRVFDRLNAAHSGRVKLLPDRCPTFAHAVALIRRTSLFLLPDGGLFHGAVAAGANVLGLFRGTDPERWAPPVPGANVMRVMDWEKSLPRIIEFIQTSLKKETLCEKR